MNDNILLLVTTAVDPRFRLSGFPSELKVKVEMLLQIEVKNNSWSETRQRGGSSTYLPLKSPKPQSSTNFDSNIFLSFYSLETEGKAAPHVNEQQDLTN